MSSPRVASSRRLVVADVPEVSRSKSDYTGDGGVADLWAWGRIRYLEMLRGFYEILCAWQGVAIALLGTNKMGTQLNA